MNFSDLKEKVLKELSEVLGEVEEKSINEFIKELTNARKVFVIGVGRVMLMSQAFAKRLNHLRIDAYVVGETTTPPIGKGYLLVASSGSGETMTTVNIAKLAKKSGARVALITARRESTLGELADFSIKIPCPTKLKLKGEFSSIQPMSNLFEQSLLLFYDCISMIIQQQRGISEEEMWSLHANLE